MRTYNFYETPTNLEPLTESVPRLQMKPLMSTKYEIVSAYEINSTNVKQVKKRFSEERRMVM